MADRDYLAVISIDCHHRRLVQDYAAVGLIDERVDGTQIYSYFVLEKFLDELHDVPPPRVEGKQEAGDLSFERQLVCPNERSVHGWGIDRKSTRPNSSHVSEARMPSSA